MSMRSGASVSQLRQLRSRPRGARIFVWAVPGTGRSPSGKGAHCALRGRTMESCCHARLCRRTEPVRRPSNMTVIQDLETPALLLDQPTLDRNIARMRAHLASLGVGLRPHVKTAKSIEVVRRAIAGQPGGITVSTLKEAEYFFAQGVKDILYAVGHCAREDPACRQPHPAWLGAQRDSGQRRSGRCSGQRGNCGGNRHPRAHRAGRGRSPIRDRAFLTAASRSRAPACRDHCGGIAWCDDARRRIVQLQVGG